MAAVLHVWFYAFLCTMSTTFIINKYTDMTATGKIATFPEK